MHQTLSAFIKALRASHVRVSVREGMEAMQAAALVGYGDRQLLKDTLGLVMAKTPDEKRAFDRTFDLFFTRELLDPSDDLAEGLEDREPGQGSELGDLLQAGDVNAITALMEQAAQDVDISNVRYSTQRGYFARRLLDRMGLRELEREIAGLQQGNGGGAGAAAAQALESGRQSLLQAAFAFVDRQQQVFGAEAGEQLREEFLEIANLSNVDRRDFERMHRIVRRIAKKLLAKHSRRLKRKRRGQLDARKTMRRNMAYDAVPFETHWKQKKIDRPKVVAICDVSRSVAAVARFLLLFLYSLNELIDEIHSFAFSSDLVDVTSKLTRLDVEAAILAILDEIGFRSTDYGQALRDLTDNHLSRIDRKTTVIILGDARSNNTDPEVERLRDVAQRAKRLIWLNPEAETLWGTGDSEMLRYRPHCHLAMTCNTVKHLERVVDDLLRTAYSA